MIAAMTPQEHLLIMWIVFSAAAFVGVAAVLIWAVRSGQFSQQDRARGLALESNIPEETCRKLRELREEEE